MTTGRRRVDLARGALLGTFAGDALGMPFEGFERAAIPAQLDMRDGRLPRGSYTDDTQMMIALAESLLARGAVDADDLARRFLQAFDAERGYGGGTRRVLELWAAGAPVQEAAGRIFGGQGSRGNGAAMRVAPVAVLFAHDPPRLLSEASASARLTHAHPVGVDGAVVQAAAIGAALRGEPILAAAQEAAATGEMRAGLRDVAELVANGAASEEIARAVGSSRRARVGLRRDLLGAGLCELRAGRDLGGAPRRRHRHGRRDGRRRRGCPRRRRRHPWALAAGARGRRAGPPPRGATRRPPRRQGLSARRRITARVAAGAPRRGCRAVDHPAGSRPTLGPTAFRRVGAASPSFVRCSDAGHR